MRRDIEYLTSDNFIKPKNTSVFHGFFTRKGGVSDGVYKGLNCGLGSDDTEDSVIQNRDAVAVKARVRNDNLLSPYQVHSADVVTGKTTWSVDKRPHADALVSEIPGIALSIVTADCAPVLFFGHKKDNMPVIGAAHAGWKGALTGVMEATLDAMQALGAQKESLRACIGPCIGQKSYEVHNDFMKPFINEDETSDRFFRTGQNAGHSNFDLSGYCACRLARYGVKYVSLLNQDTYVGEEKFYSFRRATHRNEKDYGRQISVISILDEIR